MRNIAVVLGMMTLILGSEGTAYAWRARGCGEYQNIRLVQTVPAVEMINADKAIVEDKYAQTGKAVQLVENGAEVAFDVDLTPGTFGIWLYARVPEAVVDGPWPPLYIEMHVKRPDGTVEQFRQRFAYQPTYQAAPKLYLNVHDKGRHRISLCVGKRSTTGLLLDFVEIRDELDGCVLKVLKKQRNLVSDARLASLRSTPREPQKGDPKPILSKDAGVEEMTRLAEAVWASLPPINALLGRSGGMTPELTALAKKMAAGQVFKPSGLFEPWALIEQKTEVRYDAENYARGEFLPGGLPDDGGGFYVAPGEMGTGSRGTTITRVAPFFQNRISGLLKEANTRSRYYMRTGDITAAREAAIILAALAERSPTLFNRDQWTGYNFDRVYYSRFGFANGSPLPGGALAVIYDRLFDAIRNDKALATAIGSKLSFVKKPRHLRAFLDRNTLQYELASLFRFLHNGQEMVWERSAVRTLLALGPNRIGQKWMDRFFQQCFADLTANGGYADYLVNGINRDGCNNIGGSGYAAGVPVNLLTITRTLETFVERGGKVPAFAYDPTVNPKLLEAGFFFLNYRIAGGFTSLYGDYGGALDQRFYAEPAWTDGRTNERTEGLRWLFQKTHDPRYAWLINAHGRGIHDKDDEWSAVTNAAAGVSNPVLHATTGCMPGFGDTHLELGSESKSPTMKGAACLRHGAGIGHQHGDMLDLTLYAFNRRIIADGGRAGWPMMRFTAQHNLVEVDRRTFNSTTLNAGSYAYPRLVRATPGARFASAGGWSSSHPNLKDYRRDTAMIDLGTHDIGGRPLRQYYVFDVQRVGGGKVHTYSTHAMQARDITFNAPDAPAPDAPLSLVNGTKDPRGGITVDPFVTTWIAPDKRLKEDIGLRHHLFGWGGLKFYTTRGTHPVYNRNMPFVWIERESETPLHDAYPAVYEPFCKEPNLTTVTPLTVTGGLEGTHQAHAVLVESRWGRRDIVLANEPGQPVRVEGAGALLETDAHYAFIAVDTQGVVYATMVGGTSLSWGSVELKARQAAYEGTITTFDPQTLHIKTEPPFPALPDPNGPDRAGALVGFGHLPHRTAEYVVSDGKTARLLRSPEAFRSPIVKVDEAESAVYPAIALPMTMADQAYYNGCTAANASHDRFWRVARTEISEMWMPILASISEDDITDADGDGRRTVKLTGFAPPELTRDPDILYFHPFTKPVRMRQYNRAPFEEPIELEVLRVDEQRRRLYFKPPMQDIDLMWNSWVYDATIVTSEAGNRQWRGTFPAREFRLVLEGASDTHPVVRDSDFTAAKPSAGLPKDGARRIHLYHFGPGDPYRLETHVAISRNEKGAYDVKANVENTFQVD